MTQEQAYTRALATLQGLVQKLGADAIGHVFMGEIDALESDWNARHPEWADPAPASRDTAGVGECRFGRGE